MRAIGEQKHHAKIVEDGNDEETDLGQEEGKVQIATVSGQGIQ
jgi:hypothetical protein